MLWRVAAVLLAALVCVQAQITITPALIEASEGENATFNCSETIPQADFVVEIQRTGESGFNTIPSDDPQLSLEEVGTTAVYTYGPVERAMNGSLLKCTLGGMSTDPVTLIVYYRAEYTDPGLQAVLENMTFSLDLILSANPIPADYQWQKDSVNIYDGGQFTLTVDRIAIDGALRTDAGNYTLTSTNRAGTGSISFELQVHYAPEFTSSLGTLGPECNDSGSVIVCTIMSGASGTLECSAVGSPTPDYVVTSDAALQDNIVLGSTIEVTSAIPQNTGFYSCNVSNSVGSVTREYQLGVIPVPENLRAVTTGENVVISWELSGDDDSGDDGSGGAGSVELNITYRITFTATSAPEFVETVINVQTITIALSDLEMGTQYTITVTATNLQGTSEDIAIEYTVPADCGDPTLPANSSVQSTNGTNGTREGSAVIYRCDPGLIPEGGIMIVCTASGDWSPDPSEVACRVPAPVADCGYPDPPVNGSFEGDITSTVEGSEITYQCDVGLTPEGAMTAVCGEDGEWRPDPGDVECMSMNTTEGSDNESSKTVVHGVTVGLAVGLAVTVSITLVAITGVLCYCSSRRKKNKPTFQPPEAVYEEMPGEELKPLGEIEMKENTAYGPVTPRGGPVCEVPDCGGPVRPGQVIPIGENVAYGQLHL